MTPIFVAIKTNGEVWVGNSFADLNALASVTAIYQVVNLPAQKIGTLSGTGSPYTWTNAGGFDASRAHVVKVK